MIRVNAELHQTLANEPLSKISDKSKTAFISIGEAIQRFSYVWLAGLTVEYFSCIEASVSHASIAERLLHAVVEAFISLPALKKTGPNRDSYEVLVTLQDKTRRLTIAYHRVM